MNPRCSLVERAGSYGFGFRHGGEDLSKRLFRVYRFTDGGLREVEFWDQDTSITMQGLLVSSGNGVARLRVEGLRFCVLLLAVWVKDGVQSQH